MNDRDQPPPAALDAEKAVLSTLILDGKRLSDVSGWLAPEHFFADAHRYIFAAAVTLGARGTPLDIVTLKDELHARGELARVGGPTYLHQLCFETPAPAHVADHAAAVVETAQLRAFIARSRRATVEGYTAPDRAAHMAAAVADLAQIANAGGPDKLRTGMDLVSAAFDRWQNPDRSPPIKTGIVDLDRHLRGLRRKQLITVGAHSGIGKSALAANVATHVLTREERDGMPCGVLIFTLEMSGDEFIERMACSLARVDSRKLEEHAKHEMTKEEGRALVGAYETLGRPSLVVDDRADLTAADIRSTARRAAAQLRAARTPLALVIIDYAQLVAPGEMKRRAQNREQEVALVGREMKRMAKELDVPVLLLAQLNEDAAKEGRKPRASDLRESRALMHDSDKILLLHNPAALARAEAYANGDRAPVDETTMDEVDIIVGKHRGGAPFTVRAGFWPAFCTFASLAYTPDLSPPAEPTRSTRRGRRPEPQPHPTEADA